MNAHRVFIVYTTGNVHTRMSDSNSKMIETVLCVFLPFLGKQEIIQWYIVINSDNISKLQFAPFNSVQLI